MSELELEFEENQDNPVKDFNTKSDEEQDSEHSDEWRKLDSWDNQVHKNPEVERFARTWTVPARHDSIPNLYSDLPDHQPKFNIQY